jgi:hypothetical protein
VCALGAALSFSSLASCATFDEADAVAEVGTNELDEDTFADMAASPVASDVLQSTPFEGSVTGDTARRLITTWVILNAIDDAGFISEETKTAAREEISAGYGEDWNTSPVEMQELVVLNGAIGQMIGTGAIAEAELIATVRDADVRIDPRYGRWDEAGLTVRPLG